MRTRHAEGWRKALGIVHAEAWRHQGLALLEEQRGGGCDWDAVKAEKDFSMMR